MGFHVKHIHKYVRWLKNHRASYRKDCEVSPEYARFCGRVDWALLLKNKEWLEKASMQKRTKDKG